MAPANLHHYAWTRTGATIQVHMNGPFVIAGAGSERQLQGGTQAALRAHRLVYPSLAAVHGNSSRIARTTSSAISARSSIGYSARNFPLIVPRDSRTGAMSPARPTAGRPAGRLS